MFTGDVPLTNFDLSPSESFYMSLDGKEIQDVH